MSYKSYDHTLHNILARTCNIITTFMTTSFSIEIISALKTIKSSLKWSYGKHNLTLVVISYEIYETRRRPFQGGTSVVVPCCYLFLLSVFIL